MYFKSLIAEEFKIYGNAYIQNVFSEEECFRIIGINANFENNAIFSEQSDDFSQKNPKIKFIENNQQSLWLFERLASLGTDVNKKYFNYDITALKETCVSEFTESSSVPLHRDTGLKNTKNRKLSMITFLSKQDEYQGGCPEFIPPLKKFNPEQGSVLIFPSYLTYSISPVTVNRQYIMMSWLHGPSFR